MYYTKCNFRKEQATLSANNLEDMAKDLLDQENLWQSLLQMIPFAGLPNYDEYVSTLENLDLEDKYKLSESKLIDTALQAENEMLNVNKVTNTEGGNASTGYNKITFLSSKNFSKSYSKTLHSISSIAIAGKSIGMQRDYDYSAATHFSDLKNASEIGKKAGERAVSRLNSRKIKSCNLDVIFEPRIAKVWSSFLFLYILPLLLRN